MSGPRLPDEYRLEIVAGERELGTLICSPDRLDELALGWALAQGLPVTGATRIEIMESAAGARAAVDVDGQEVLDWKRYVLSGFDAGMLLGDAGSLVSVDAGMAAAVFDERLGEVFEGFRAARGDGGFHHAALADGEGVQAVVADVSRHNAVDKVVGIGLRRGVEPSQSAIFLSGRISTDIVLKAARFGAGIVATRSLPTRQAAELAERLGVMLICRAIDLRRVSYGPSRLG